MQKHTFNIDTNRKILVTTCKFHKKNYIKFQ